MGYSPSPGVAEMTSALPVRTAETSAWPQSLARELTGVSIVYRPDVVQHEALLARWISHDNLAVVTGKDPHPVFLHQAPHLERSKTCRYVNSGHELSGF